MDLLLQPGLQSGPGCFLPVMQEWQEEGRPDRIICPETEQNCSWDHTEIQTDLEAGNYDIALYKAEQLYWPPSDISGQKRWNKQREGLVKVIKEAKKHAK